MANHWDWFTCRQWSETVFTMIADGHLPDGWEDRYAIKDVQRDVCALGTHLDHMPPTLKPRARDLTIDLPVNTRGQSTTRRQMENRACSGIGETTVDLRPHTVSSQTENATCVPGALITPRR